MIIVEDYEAIRRAGSGKEGNGVVEYEQNHGRGRRSEGHDHGSLFPLPERRDHEVYG
ncbi:MAG: hypothetical protein NVS4B7_16580 [Ktedonobacteraceae bacterium]